MKNIVPILAVIAINMAHADPRVTYVGDGRYACSGSQRECAPIRQRNEDRERQQESERQHREQPEKQRRQTRVLEDIRDELRCRD